MKLLLDTHVLLWWLNDDPRLGESARSAIADPDNEVAFSAASAWEITIRSAAGRLDIQGDLSSALAASGFTALPITVAHAFAAGALPPHHQDPFDRMLVAQAQLEDLVIATGDPNIARYEIRVVTT